jgi:hypothetical protein
MEPFSNNSCELAESLRELAFLLFFGGILLVPIWSVVVERMVGKSDKKGQIRTGIVVVTVFSTLFMLLIVASIVEQLGDCSAAWRERNE